MTQKNYVDNLLPIYIEAVKSMDYPTQSPDLNPIEGIWAIVKQRLRRRIFDSKEEMKETLQEERDKITQEEIQHRIADMNRKMHRTCTIKRRFSSRYTTGSSDLLQI